VATGYSHQLFLISMSYRTRGPINEDVRSVQSSVVDSLGCFVEAAGDGLVVAINEARFLCVIQCGPGKTVPWMSETRRRSFQYVRAVNRSKTSLESLAGA
jgi:hypothetical protein